MTFQSKVDSQQTLETIFEERLQETNFWFMMSVTLNLSLSFYSICVFIQNHTQLLFYRSHL